MRWQRIDLDAVLYAIWKTMEETSPRSQRYRIFRALFDRLSAAARGEQLFTIAVDCDPEDRTYQRVVDAVRARRRQPCK